MALWMIFGALTIVSLAWVLWPVFRRADSEVVADRAFDSEVYRDQLRELERDAERGLINEKEKESARNEVSRRLLAAKTAMEKAERGAKINNKGRRNGVLAVSLTGVIAVAGLLYNKIGTPDMPDLPQEQRLANAMKNKDMPALILQVTRFLDKNPKDIKGWKVLAPALGRANRFQEAANAYARIIQLEGPRPDTLVSYAESALLANRGEPTDRVKQAINAAISLDPKYAKARFYKAMVLQQEGHKEQALKEWRTLLQQNPKNLELQMAVQRQIAAIKKQSGGNPKLPSLDKDQRRAAANMTPQERQKMIRSMVSRLADRLKENGNNLDDWLKLLRVRKVLGEKDQAMADLKTARENFKDDKQALARLDSAARELGLQ
jgi:cytochrome c-type biogenesis protein CcmH